MASRRLRSRPAASSSSAGPSPTRLPTNPTGHQFLIEEGQRCVSVDGALLHDSMSLGVRTWGNDPHGATAMLIGAYERVGASADRLMAVLPRLLVLHREEWSCPLLPVLADEIARDQLGQEGVLDRLVDLVLVSALRDWLTRGDGTPTSWYLAHSDPVVGPALQAMTSDLAHGWTVAELAGMANVSQRAVRRPLLGSGRHAAAHIPHRAQAVDRCRPPARARRDDRCRRPRGGLQHAVRTERGVQARPRRQPEGSPDAPERRLSRSVCATASGRARSPSWRRISVWTTGIGCLASIRSTNSLRSNSSMIGLRLLVVVAQPRRQRLRVVVLAGHQLAAAGVADLALLRAAADQVVVEAAARADAPRRAPAPATSSSGSSSRITPSMS